jgi:hypothetical protein
MNVVHTTIARAKTPLALRDRSPDPVARFAALAVPGVAPANAREAFAPSARHGLRADSERSVSCVKPWPIGGENIWPIQTADDVIEVVIRQLELGLMRG